ncbi:MAG: DUF1295 domain-containing protein [Candidatus Omnitrophica bacterium]|nr:DUF1295 domain-containing protein [Candidatus Omnitrophota bacterium]
MIWELLGAGFLLAFGLMSVIWYISYRQKNAGIVDGVWSLSIALITWMYALTGDGDPMRRLLIAGLIGFWGLRLAAFLYWTRIRGKHEEDPRYTQLRDKWGKKAELRMFLFFQFQGLAALLFSLPALLMSVDPRAGCGALEILGIGVWAVALFGETLADFQLHRFKKDPANRGQVCRAGLWNYSRHPNYFFEWLIWVAVSLAALPSPYGWVALVCPVAMLHFLFNVTGIPATEAQALKTKGEGYRQYQRSTSPFVPWFKKKGVS